VFTKDEILRATAPGAPGILAPSSFSQTIWHEQSGGFIVVTSQNSDLPEVFDVMPYVERMLDGNFYDDAAGLEISLCRPFDIRVGEQTIQVFDINSQGWCWESTNGLEFDAAGKVIDTASTPAAL
jgi:hypothetical protein